MDGKATCSRCKTEYIINPDKDSHERSKCPACGSESRLFFQKCEGNIPPPYSKLKTKAKHQGKGKPFHESVSGIDLFRKKNTLSRIERVIDRENDYYRESITDVGSGKVIHQCEERLSDHQGHGSAKKTD